MENEQFKLITGNGNPQPGDMVYLAEKRKWAPLTVNYCEQLIKKPEEQRPPVIRATACFDVTSATDHELHLMLTRCRKEIVTRQDGYQVEIYVVQLDQHSHSFKSRADAHKFATEQAFFIFDPDLPVTKETYVGCPSCSIKWIDEEVYLSKPDYWMDRS